MRIIGGKYKGRVIPVVKNFSARPTTDLAREGLFNILNNYFDFNSIQVLDLFAGTGSISLEFASRGCNNIYLIEQDYRSIKFIEGVVDKLNIEGIIALKIDVLKFLPKCKERYDIIFADPPYNMENIEELPKLIFKYTILKEKGWFILEHSKKQDFSFQPHFRESRKYGSVHFSIFEK